MPHATNKYPFEWRLFEQAGRFSHSLAGAPFYAFLVVLTVDGRTQRILVGDEPQHHDPAWSQAMDAAPAWFFYDPFEGPEYTYIQWNALGQKTIERLFGFKFDATDFSVGGKAIAFPTSWGVMF